MDGFRLPTEPGAGICLQSWSNNSVLTGDNLTKSDANIDGSSKKVVGSYKPNAFGLYDMHGNGEWCEGRGGDYLGSVERTQRVRNKRLTEWGVAVLWMPKLSLPIFSLRSLV